ncbi:hypothetical protein Dip510_001950 [Elusimicrobium posterum]
MKDEAPEGGEHWKMRSKSAAAKPPQDIRPEYVFLFID